MKKTTQKRTRSRRAPAANGDGDVIAVLERQHREVEELIAQFEKASSNEDARAVAMDLCDKLTVHSKVEEEIFYPAAQLDAGAEERDLVLEAEEEHLSVKRIIEDVEELEAGDDRLRPKVNVLKKQVMSHVDEEEHALFPKVRRKLSKAERDALGKELHDRTAQLEAAASNGASPSGRHAWPGASPAHPPENGPGRRGH